MPPPRITLKEWTCWQTPLWYSDQCWVTRSQHLHSQPLVRKHGSRIGAHPFWHTPAEIVHQVKAAGKVMIIRQWRRYRRHRGAGGSQSSTLILGKRDTGGTSLGQWAGLISWVMMKGKWYEEPEVPHSCWWWQLDHYQSHSGYSHKPMRRTSSHL